MNALLSGIRSMLLKRIFQEARTGSGTVTGKNFSTNTEKHHWLRSFVQRKCVTWSIGLASIPAGYYAWNHIFSPVTVHAIKAKRKENEVKTIKLTSRERRFLRFASVDYDGQLYMTPQDFLESVVEAEPRPRLKRKTLSKQDLDSIREHTPELNKGSPQMFRNLRDKGIISYTEYLFLLSILTKPQTGFRIAFNMFDTDGNEKVDKNEFLVNQLGKHCSINLVLAQTASTKQQQNVPYRKANGLTQLLITSNGVHSIGLLYSNVKNGYCLLLYLIPLHTYKQEFSIQKMQVFVRHSILERCERRTERVSTPTPQSDTSSNPKLEEIFSLAWKEKRGIVPHETGSEGVRAADEKSSTNARIEEILNDILVDDDRGLQRRHFVDTTLLVHFFGPKGQRDIRYEDFKKFMEDLQTEVQELEFHEFSKGLDCISQIDFAKILLRYTYLDSEEYDLYLQRLTNRIKLEQGITFLEFRSFCQFLNNLDDFSVAMRMYTLADRPISQEEFRRAVRICTGTNLSPHVVDTVFQIFDADNDSHLSHREFIGVMKDRLHRGFKLSSKAEGLEAFRSCLKQELRAA